MKNRCAPVILQRRLKPKPPAHLEIWRRRKSFGGNRRAWRQTASLAHSLTWTGGRWRDGCAVGATPQCWSSQWRLHFASPACSRTNISNKSSARGASSPSSSPSSPCLSSFSLLTSNVRWQRRAVMQAGMGGVPRSWVRACALQCSKCFDSVAVISQRCGVGWGAGGGACWSWSGGRSCCAKQQFDLKSCSRYVF